MKKLIGLYQLYFELQEENFAIQHDRKNWPDGCNYEWMVNRVNELTLEIRRVAKEIKSIESKIANL